MRLVYKFNEYDRAEELLSQCAISNGLYNQALYVVRTSLDNGGGFLFYNDLDRILKNTVNLEGRINYRMLKAQVAQQCLKVLDKNIKSYIKSIKDYSKNKEKYKGRPHLPGYRKKGGYNQLIYTNQSCRITDDGQIMLSKDLEIRIPQFEKYKERLKRMQQVRVNPRNGYVEVEIVYDTDTQNENPLDKSG